MNKKRIEAKLRNYESKKAQLKNMIVDETRYPISAMTYDGVFTSDSNDFHSIVEEVVEDRESLSEETKELMEELNKLNNCLNSLNAKEYDLISDKYFEGMTYEEMADGTYGTWRPATIFDWVEKILKRRFNSLKKGD